MTASDGHDDLAPCWYAKGLLKPFKGKGEILKFLDELEAVLPALWQEGATFANQYNSEVRRVGLLLTPHSGKGRLVRPVMWRNANQSKMGVHLLDSVLNDGGVPQRVKERLVDIETERLIFNAKLASVARQIPRLKHLLGEIDKAESLIQNKNTL